MLRPCGFARQGRLCLSASCLAGDRVSSTATTPVTVTGSWRRLSVSWTPQHAQLDRGARCATSERPWSGICRGRGRLARSHAAGPSGPRCVSRIASRPSYLPAILGHAASRATGRRGLERNAPVGSRRPSGWLVARARRARGRQRRGSPQAVVQHQPVSRVEPIARGRDIDQHGQCGGERGPRRSVGRRTTPSPPMIRTAPTK